MKEYKVVVLSAYRTLGSDDQVSNIVDSDQKGIGISLDKEDLEELNNKINNHETLKRIKFKTLNVRVVSA